MTSNGSDVDYGADRRDQIIVGVVYCTVCTVCLVPYLLILAVLQLRADRFQGPAFRIMFQLGITECLQLLFHFTGGVFCFADSTFSHWVNKFCGGVLNAAWVALIPFTLVLALNRFITIFFFGNANYDRPIYTTILIILCWLWASLFFASYMTDYCSVIYDKDMYTWGYDESLLWSNTINNTEYYTITAQLVATGFVYVLVVCRIAVTRKKFPKRGSNQSNALRQEIRVLVQAIIISGYAGFCLFAWHSYQIFAEDSKWTFFVINLLWIINGGVNPFIYLTMNRTIRLSTVTLLKGILLGKGFQLQTTTLAGPKTVSPLQESPFSLSYRSSRRDNKHRLFHSTAAFVGTNYT